jgi:hypothetical protein
VGETISTSLLERYLCQVSKKKCMGCKFKITKYVGGYDMDGAMLNLGSDINILTKKSWEVMGKTKLVWSPIQL